MCNPLTNLLKNIFRSDIIVSEVICMNKEFHAGNRRRMYNMIKPASLLLLFAGDEIRKTNDEYYPFFAERDFVYMTGIRQKQSVLMAVKDASGTVTERMYMLPPDAFAERWTGRRLTPAEVEDISAVSDIRPLPRLENEA